MELDVFCGVPIYVGLGALNRAVAHVAEAYFGEKPCPGRLISESLSDAVLARVNDHLGDCKEAANRQYLNHSCLEVEVILDADTISQERILLNGVLNCFVHL